MHLLLLLDAVDCRMYASQLISHPLVQVHRFRVNLTECETYAQLVFVLGKRPWAVILSQISLPIPLSKHVRLSAYHAQFRYGDHKMKRSTSVGNMAPVPHFIWSGTDLSGPQS